MSAVIVIYKGAKVYDWRLGNKLLNVDIHRGLIGCLHRVDLWTRLLEGVSSVTLNAHASQSGRPSNAFCRLFAGSAFSGTHHHI